MPTAHHTKGGDSVQQRLSVCPDRLQLVCHIIWVAQRRPMNFDASFTGLRSTHGLSQPPDELMFRDVHMLLVSRLLDSRVLLSSLREPGCGHTPRERSPTECAPLRPAPGGTRH